MHDFFQAVKIYSKALEKIPRYKEAHVNIGQAYKDLANLPFALKHFNKVYNVWFQKHLLKDINKYHLDLMKGIWLHLSVLLSTKVSKVF